jgi:hypothetical protein
MSAVHVWTDWTPDLGTQTPDGEWWIQPITAGVHLYRWDVSLCDYIPQGQFLTVRQAQTHAEETA